MIDVAASREVRLIATLTPKSGREAELSEAIREAVLDVVQEDGCLYYVAYESLDRPGTVLVYEGWADKDAHEAHIASPPFKRLAARLPDLLGEPLALEHLRRIA